MPWPQLTDYQEAVQHPRRCFNDPELRQGTPQLDSLGLPRPITGGFASVYQFTCGGRRYAVRCFVRPVEDEQRRYEASAARDGDEPVGRVGEVVFDRVWFAYTAGSELDDRSPEWVLKDVSFDVRGGEFVSIVGPSGCGKSTLLHLLGGLDKPNGGHVLIGGHNLSDLNDDKVTELRRRKIGFVFQGFNLLARTTALANCELPLIYSGVSARERRARALAAEGGDHVDEAIRGLDEGARLISDGERLRGILTRSDLLRALMEVEEAARAHA